MTQITVILGRARGLGRAAAGSSILALLALGACGGEAGDDSAPVETRGYELQNIESYGAEFARSIIVNPTGTGSDISATLDPAICTNRVGAFMVVSRDDKKRYRAQYSFGPIGQYMTAWKVFSAASPARTFNSSPACAMREDSSGGDAQFVLVGKGTDNRLYASTGTLPVPDVDLPVPVIDEDWVALNTRTYGSGGTDLGPATPALASKAGVNLPGTPGITGAMVLAFISGNTVYAHHHALPYDDEDNHWEARLAAPPLPSGATPVGAPAITFLDGWVQAFHVIVRAQINGQDRFYETYFGRTKTGENTYGPGFCGVLCGSMSPSWTQLPITTTISSSPALEFSPVHGETLYFRSGSKLKQTSGYATSQQLGTLPILELYPGLGDSFTGAPSAVGGYQFEVGSHLVVARTTNNEVRLLESDKDSDLIP